MELLGCGDRSDGGIHHLISGDAVSTSSSSFTALLELPHSQAVQLLHSPLAPPPTSIAFPPDGGLVERAARFSVFSGESPDTTSGPAVKCEPLDSSSPFLSSLSAPLVSDPTVEDNSAPPSLRQAKRKEREKKGNNNNNGSKKKSKSGAGKESSDEAEKLPYVHVRARRGQATDSHSLAERARREKINARMKLLQELVPGCNKISGTALVLDEIINHVQSLQRQVEFLSMRLAAVNPSIDFNLDSILAVENGSMVDRSFAGMIMPLMWSELQFSGNRQHYQQQWPIDPLNQQVWVREENSLNFIAPDLSYDSSGNSVSLLSNQVKMEL